MIMKKYILFIFSLTICVNVFSQLNPLAYNLASAPYFFSNWNSDSAAGTFPESMYFLQYEGDDDPSKNTEPNQLWLCTYNNDSRSRFVGLGINGIGIINSGSVQDTEDRCGNGSNLGNRVGAVVLALNTIDMEDIELSWKIRMIEIGNGKPLPRDYRVSAQYRSDSTSAWNDFPSSTIYSTQGKIKGDVQNLKVLLPKSLENKEYVQVRWKYYQEDANQGGTRPFIAIDDIKVTGLNSVSGYQPFIFIENETLETFGCVEGNFSEIDSVIVSAAYLKNDLNITIEGNFYISLNKLNGYSQNINLASQEGEVSDRIIYIKKECVDSVIVESQKFIFTSLGIRKQLVVRGEKYPQLYINEMVASNFKSYYDKFSVDYPDWIELYNPNNVSVQLGGYYLTDDLNNLKKFKIPIRTANTILENGFLLYIANGNPNLSSLHINFSLSTYGETVFIVGKNGKTIIDSLSYHNLETDISVGRKTDGSSEIVLFKTTTPNASNNNAITYGVKSAPPVFLDKSGLYDNAFLLKLSAENPTAKIYYTLDGSVPSEENLGGFLYEFKQSYNKVEKIFYIGDSYFRPYRSYFYSEPINLSLYRDKTFWLGDINATYSAIPFVPKIKRSTANVIRAIAVEPGKEPSDIITNTYFFKNDDSVDNKLPIISITLNEEQFKGFYNGIAVAGIDYESWRNTGFGASFTGSPANYTRRGRDNEIPVNIEIFENYKSQLNQIVGARINGASSRSFAHKSLRLYSRNFYGKEKFTYPFFKNLPYDDYKAIILRNSGSDFYTTFFKDAFCQQLLSGLKIDFQDYNPYNIYINGEYFGLLNARERLDVNYLKRKYGFEDDKIDFLQYNSASISGDDKKYQELISIVENDSMMSDNTFKVLQTRMDMDNYIDYNSFEIYAGNNDWPFNNVRYWRYKTDTYTPKAPYGLDGRFRWVVFDLDNSYYLNLVDFNSLENAIIPVLNLLNPKAQFLFRSLNNNKDFKLDFITRYSDLLNTYFKPNRIINKIDGFRNLLSHDMYNHLNRWETLKSMDDWYAKVNELEQFAQRRPDACRLHMKDIYGLSDTAQVTLDVDDINKGHIKINTIEIDRNTPGVDTNKVYQWKGIYFKNLPITFIPIPADGYKFSHWETTDSTSLIDTLKFDLKKPLYVKAYFEVDENYIYDPLAAKINDCPYEFNNWSSQQPEGAKPESMQFYYTRYPDSKSNGPLEGKLEDIAYDYDSKTRINGLGSLGISLVNSATANDNYYQTRLGAVAVAVSTKDIQGAELSFTLGTINPKSKKYSIRLQYRLSDKGDVSDFYDKSGQLVDYKGNYNAESEQKFKVDLPDNLLGQKYVQLIWRYYYNGEQVDLGSDSRDELRIDDIIIQQKDIVANKTTGDYDNILVASSNSKTFQWYKCDNDTLILLENETQKELKIKQPGEYAVAVDYGNCKHISDCSYFFVKELKQFAPSIHSSIIPNPSNGNFDVMFDEMLTDVRIVVLDAIGKVYDTKTFNQVKNVHFDASKWAKGVYILNISTLDGRKDSQKVILQ
jgi:hypothetical protein